MNEVNELGVLRRIVESLAVIDPWDTEGPYCRICGGAPVLRRSERGGYFYTETTPGSHTTDCPWHAASEWKLLTGEEDK